MDHLHQSKNCQGKLVDFDIIGKADNDSLLGINDSLLGINDSLLGINESLLIKKFTPTLISTRATVDHVVIERLMTLVYVKC